jgi:hypothetical protein
MLVTQAALVFLSTTRRHWHPFVAWNQPCSLQFRDTPRGVSFVQCYRGGSFAVGLAFTDSKLRVRSASVLWI